MAVSDVYSLTVELELPDKEATVNFHYQELTPPEIGDAATTNLAEGWMQTLGVNEMRGLLSNDVAVTGVKVYKLSGTPEPPGYATDRNPGANVGVPLPANNGLRVGIVQGFFPSNRNGLVWIPGVRELDCNGNSFTSAFMNGAVTAFTVALGVNLVGPDSGLWRLGVLSRKFVDDNPGDYIGAFADAIAATASPIVGTQKRRTTDRRGAPGAVV